MIFIPHRRVPNLAPWLPYPAPGSVTWPSSPESSKNSALLWDRFWSCDKKQLQVRLGSGKPRVYVWCTVYIHVFLTCLLPNMFLLFIILMEASCFCFSFESQPSHVQNNDKDKTKVQRKNRARELATKSSYHLLAVRPYIMSIKIQNLCNQQIWSQILEIFGIEQKILRIHKLRLESLLVANHSWDWNWTRGSKPWLKDAKDKVGRSTGHRCWLNLQCFKSYTTALWNEVSHRLR